MAASIAVECGILEGQSCPERQLSPGMTMLSGAYMRPLWRITQKFAYNLVFPLAKVIGIPHDKARRCCKFKNSLPFFVADSIPMIAVTIARIVANLTYMPVQVSSK